jgi:hypothetical protein
MKADVENDIDNGTFAWVCSSCTKLKPNVAESSMPQPPPNIINVRKNYLLLLYYYNYCNYGIFQAGSRKAGSSPHVIADSPIGKALLVSGTPSKHQNYVIKPAQTVPYLQSFAPGSSSTHVSISQRQHSASNRGSDSTPDTSSWQDYISPIVRIRKGYIGYLPCFILRLVY